jgi:tripartite-type tricarboxylate transporter receptor subunit TctC
VRRSGISSRKVAGRGAVAAVLLATVVGCGDGDGTASSSAQEVENPFEGETIDFVVPFDPGGGYDVYTRTIAPFMAECLGAEMVVRNEPGAGSLLATNATAAAEPDGTRIQIMNMPGALAAQIAGDEGARFDLGEFSWIGRIAAPPEVVLTGKDSDLQTFQDVVDSGDKLKFVATGPGSSDYINGNVVAKAFELDYDVATGFAGAGEATTSVIAGQADLHVMPYDSVVKNFTSGDARPLVVLSEELPQYMPEAPLIGDFEPSSDEGQQLLDDLAALTSAGRSVTAPPGMDEARLDALREAFTCAMEDEKLLAELDGQKRPVNFVEGAEYAGLVDEALDPSEEFAAVIKSSY